MEQNEIELSSLPAVIYLPENAVEVEMIVTVFSDGKIEKVAKTLDMKALKEAFCEAEI